MYEYHIYSFISFIHIYYIYISYIHIYEKAWDSVRKTDQDLKAEIESIMRNQNEGNQKINKRP